MIITITKSGETELREPNDFKGFKILVEKPDASGADIAASLKGVATVDPDGFVWSVSVFEGKLARFAPDGKLDRVVNLPVENATSLSFGGPDLDVAYVTSMARPIKGVRPREPNAGGLFAVHGLGVRGLPEPRFKG